MVTQKSASKSPGKPITIVVADDHPVFRFGIMNILKGIEHLSVVGEAENGPDAIEKIVQNKPDIAVIDVEMPGKNGLEVCQELIQLGISTKLIIFTMYKEEELFNKAMDIGVFGYLLKETAMSELTECIHTISKEEKYVSKNIENYLSNRKSKFISNEFMNQLTTTEKKILQLIADQKTSKEIAGKLFVSEKTVENHRYNITKKLALENGNSSLLKFAIENRMIING